MTSPSEQKAAGEIYEEFAHGKYGASNRERTLASMASIIQQAITEAVGIEREKYRELAKKWRELAPRASEAYREFLNQRADELEDIMGDK